MLHEEEEMGVSWHATRERIPATLQLWRVALPCVIIIRGRWREATHWSSSSLLTDDAKHRYTISRNTETAMLQFSNCQQPRSSRQQH